MKIYCDTCITTPGRLYKHADPTTGQYVECDHSDMTYDCFKEQIEDILFEIDGGAVDIGEDKPKKSDYVIKELNKLLKIVLDK